jgi:hypothetical protein
MFAASSLQNNSLFPRFDVVEERFIHVDDDDRLTAEAVNKNVAHPTEKDCSSMRGLDLGDAVRHLIAAPRKAPALPKGSAPTLGGLRTSQCGGDVRVVGRQGQVVETSQKKLQNSRGRHQQATLVQSVHNFGYVTLHKENLCLLPQMIQRIGKTPCHVCLDCGRGPNSQMVLRRSDGQSWFPSVLAQLCKSNTVQCEVRAAT